MTTRRLPNVVVDDERLSLPINHLAYVVDDIESAV